MSFDCNLFVVGTGSGGSATAKQEIDATIGIHPTTGEEFLMLE